MHGTENGFDCIGAGRAGLMKRTGKNSGRPKAIVRNRTDLPSQPRYNPPSL